MTAARYLLGHKWRLAADGALVGTGRARPVVQRHMAQGFRLREATTEDTDVLADVHTRTAYYTAGGMPENQLADPSAREQRREAWARVLAAPARATLVAEDTDGTVIGLLTAGPPHHEDLNASTSYELYQIGVLPRAWGRGVGGALHRKFVTLATAAGCAEGVLECWASNTRAQGFYVRNGWRPDGARRPGPLDHDYVRLRLKLASRSS
ncbi:GNAT family N-acetyltransferase [Streptomyces sp. NBC_01518]|uniref:GNAT family N-acetyltransferase n=1 Tax=Streptomyces sp. NBC_01518 TaxID=2903891 RepID=UPI0038654B0D